jgi:hypothetical protein
LALFRSVRVEQARASTQHDLSLPQSRSAHAAKAVVIGPSGARAPAVDVQREMAERNADMPAGTRIEFRVGINLGDIIIDGDDIFGDGVNVAARLETLAEPGGICVSRVVRDQVRDKLAFAFEDMGEQQVKNIARPVRAHRIRIDAAAATPPAAAPPFVLPDKPSIAVLPYQNMSGDPEQEYFADGMVEDIISELSRFRALFVIERNSTFTYKGKPVDVRQDAPFINAQPRCRPISRTHTSDRERQPERWETPHLALCCLQVRSDVSKYRRRGEDRVRRSTVSAL